MNIYIYKIEAIVEPEDESNVYEGIVYAESYPDAMARIVKFYGEEIVTVDELTETELKNIAEFYEIRRYFHESI